MERVKPANSTEAGEPAATARSSGRDDVARRCEGSAKSGLARTTPWVIPFFELREPVLPGGVTLGVSGVLVLTGTAVGIAFAQRRARVLGLPHGAISGAILGALGAGFLVSHAVELIPYRPDPLDREYPRALLDFWNGPISFEGFCAARAGRPADFA